MFNSHMRSKQRAWNNCLGHIFVWVVFINGALARPQGLLGGLIGGLTGQPTALTCTDGNGATYTNGSTIVDQGRVYQVVCNTNILQTALSASITPSLTVCVDSCV
ncbi:hypothetical protein PMIN06_012539, partial [Paraphaeosphaeria minitans]